MTNINISIFRARIENRFGKAIKYSKDCESLSRHIENVCKDKISATTLKRIFGFAEAKGKPRKYTLDVISKYLGFADWETLLKNQNNGKYLIKDSSDKENDLHYYEDSIQILRHSILNFILTKKINIDQVLTLTKRFGRNKEFIGFILELIKVASELKSLPFLKNIFNLPFIFDERYHQLMDIYYIGQNLGIMMRYHPDLAKELFLIYADNKKAQFFFIEWFVDEDYLMGYYGDLIDAYHKNKQKQKESIIFYYALKYLKYKQEGNIILQKKCFDILRRENISSISHPIPCARWIGTSIIEENIPANNLSPFIQSTLEKFTEKTTYETSICFLFYLMRYCFRDNRKDWIIFLKNIFIEKTESKLEKESSHWGVKVENQLKIYLSYGFFLENKINQANALFQSIDTDLFEPFIFNQMHLDYNGVSSLLSIKVKNERIEQF